MLSQQNKHILFTRCNHKFGSNSRVGILVSIFHQPHKCILQRLSYDTYQQLSKQGFKIFFETIFSVRSLAKNLVLDRFSCWSTLE